MTNLLFSQLTAMPKRLAMVLTVLFTVGVGQMWGETYELDATTHIVSTVSNYSTTEATLTGTNNSQWKVKGYGSVANTSLTIGKGGANYLKTPTCSEDITSVTVTWTGNTSYYLALQTTSGNEIEAQKNQSSDFTYTFDVSGKGYKQLQLVGRRNSGTSNAAAVITKVVVEYGSSAPAVTHTVTWDVNGDQSVTTQVTEGSKPTFPATPASCDDESDTFYGWSTATWDGKINDLNGKTIYTSANNMPEVNGAVTYYAVFAKTSEDSSGDYKLVTSSSNLKSGVAYLGSQISYSGVRYYYMSSTAISSNLLSISNATVSSNILQTPNSEGKINLVSTGTANQYYIKNAEGKYLYSNAAGSLSWSTTACSWTFSNMNSTTGLAELTSSANSNIKLRAYGTSTTQGKLKTYSGTTNYGICVFLAEATTTYSDYITTCSTQTSLCLVQKEVVH